jgi:hypothetical protein
MPHSTGTVWIIVGVVSLVLALGSVTAAVAAITQWILAVRNRLPGLPWWKAPLLAGSAFTARGQRHRRRAWHLLLAAVGLWFAAGFLSVLLL